MQKGGERADQARASRIKQAKAGVRLENYGNVVRVTRNREWGQVSSREACLAKEVCLHMSLCIPMTPGQIIRDDR